MRRQRVGNGDGGAPLGEAAAHLEVFVEALRQIVEALAYFLALGRERKVDKAFVDLDARDDPLLLQVLGEERAVVRLLARSLVEQDDARDVLLDARRAEKRLPIGAAVLFSALHLDGLEAFLAGAARFVGSEDALALRDHSGR